MRSVVEFVHRAEHECKIFVSFPEENSQLFFLCYPLTV